MATLMQKTSGTRRTTILALAALLGGPAAYPRMFATHADAGAFTDARQSARVEVVS